MTGVQTCALPILITKFHDEILQERGEIPNFASFLRVTCVRYLRRSMIDLEKKLEASLGYAYEGSRQHESTEVALATGTYGSVSSSIANNVCILKR